MPWLVLLLTLLFSPSIPAGDLTQRLLAGEDPPPPQIPGEETGPPPAPNDDRPAVWRDFTPESLGLSDKQARWYQTAVEAYFFRDYPLAARLWRRLAEQGHPRSQARLGWLYHSGRGVKKDLAEARRWYRQAARGGDVVAQNNLAALLEHGLGGPKDEAEARAWYRRAAEAGYPPAQFNLGVMLAEGRGGAADPDQAGQWWRRAASAGLEAAKRRLPPEGTPQSLRSPSGVSPTGSPGTR